MFKHQRFVFHSEFSQLLPEEEMGRPQPQLDITIEKLELSKEKGLHSSLIDFELSFNLAEVDK